MCGFDEAMVELDYFPKVIGRAQPWYCDLQVGKNILIPIAAFKKVRISSLCFYNKQFKYYFIYSLSV